ncbi:MAG TPA: DUF4232 domain-containing protein [Actinophytocola sp.]|uniref:DUF4232 domain-containing protein n=1 Tax=Actinophytocola sp. TaxID=1872138 RepID=UPI002DB9FE78|nr:DUF4232 domain-containing protein [Actinophytocola sp.]HEU5473243.1 DUF4232 domain-containing protein [Actinophytocola sp.]
MKRSRVLVVAAVVATGCAGCTGDVGGGPAAPEVPTFASSTGAALPPPVSGPVSESVSASAPAPPAPPAEQPEPIAGPDECRSTELKLSLGQGDAAAGTAYRPLRFTNAGARTCTIQGFPGVSYVTGDDGHQVGPAAFRVGSKGAAVALAPGVTANAPVGFIQVRNFDPAVCRPTPVRGLRVYPPHETASLFVPMDGLGCAGTPPDHQLLVKTVQAGAGA